MNYKVSERSSQIDNLLITYQIKFCILEQYESIEEENRQVHSTNTATITRLQELENTSSQLHVNRKNSIFV